MAIFRVKRSGEFEGKIIEAYLTDEGKYGIENEAIFFSNRNAALNAIKNDPYNDTGDYKYTIEEI